jgi:polyhydroxyalkanoate synthesis regulator phasin
MMVTCAHVAENSPTTEIEGAIGAREGRHPPEFFRDTSVRPGNCVCWKFASHYPARAMIDAIKKAMLTGVGAAVLTSEKVEAALSDWVKRGKITAEDARAMGAKVAEEGKAEFEKASRQVRQPVNDMLEKAGMGQKDRMDSLEKRLLALEIEVANLNTRLHNQQPM